MKIHSGISVAGSKNLKLMIPASVVGYIHSVYEPLEKSKTLVGHTSKLRVGV